MTQFRRAKAVDESTFPPCATNSTRPPLWWKYHDPKVTPSGFAQMTHMLTALSRGKLLVILEGGYNLQSISSSATAVVKVLLGENPGYDTSDVMPSRAGLQTILQVMEIQLKFWPSLKPNYTLLRSKWELVSSNRSE